MIRADPTAFVGSASISSQRNRHDASFGTIMSISLLAGDRNPVLDNVPDVGLVHFPTGDGSGDTKLVI